MMLFTGLTFLRIKSSDLFFYQWIYPIIATVAGVIIYLCLPVKPPIFGPTGIISSTNTLLGVLVGFYIAALAAIATFKKDSLDKPMRGLTPTLEAGGGTESLSRRRFLCILFGYLSLISIMLFVLGAMATIFQPSIAKIPKLAAYSEILKATTIGIYCFIWASILLCTLIGLHYLTDRIHRD